MASKNKDLLIRIVTFQLLALQSLPQFCQNDFIYLGKKVRSSGICKEMILIDINE